MKRLLGILCTLILVIALCCGQIAQAAVRCPKCDSEMSLNESLQMIPGKQCGESFYVCKKCGHSEWRDIVHAGVITLSASKATCTTPGSTEGQKCTVCKAVLVAQEKIPAKNHKYGDTVKSRKDGTHRYICERCTYGKNPEKCSYEYVYISDGKHKATCTICGYEVTGACDYGEGNACLLCGQSKPSAPPKGRTPLKNTKLNMLNNPSANNNLNMNMTTSGSGTSDDPMNITLEGSVNEGGSNVTLDGPGELAVSTAELLSGSMGVVGLMNIQIDWQQGLQGNDILRNTPANQSSTVPIYNITTTLFNESDSNPVAVQALNETGTAAQSLIRNGGNLTVSLPDESVSIGSSSVAGRALNETGTEGPGGFIDREETITNVLFNLPDGAVGNNSDISIESSTFVNNTRGQANDTVIDSDVQGGEGQIGQPAYNMVIGSEDPNFNITAVGIDGDSLLIQFNASGVSNIEINMTVSQIPQD